ncbi:AAA family ATPase [Rahnella laticis]|uniref:AAA family ATPase n=2 Tax=Rahnella TaxID=34037 RepID=A0ABS0E8N5_9GAMM|nr:AAA family ATPase [Rahnella laticis]MBF8000262.1 AAA family ATPase [Rahnella sp. LAC-M12]
MNLIRLKVNGLFGMLDYNIPLDNHEFTILTGPNGYGKTILLRIIKDILINDLTIFEKLKFENIILSTDVAEIEISKTIKTKKKSITLIVTEGSSRYEEKIYYKDAPEKLDCNNEDLLKQNFYIKFWAKDGSVVKDEHTDSKSKYTSNVLDKFFSSEGVTFIKAQRLETKESKNTVIDDYALKLIQLMELATSESAKISQRLDTTFPSRLFDMIADSQLAAYGNISDRLIGIQDKRKLYMGYGLIDSEIDLLPSNTTHVIKNNEYLNVLKLYIDDGLEKLAPFESLFSRIDLFSTLLKEKILSFKKVKFDRQEGFIFVSDIGDVIDRNMLSSGEQNQVVILFDLIFNSKDKNVILIDEPEISLHVAWQKEFLNSLKKIQKINKSSKYIIATHSPQIIDNKWELTYDLFEATKGNLK